MISQEITQLARSSLLLLNYAEQQGLDRQRLIRVAGLSSTSLDDPDSRIKTKSMIRLWRAVIDALDDPYLGWHVGASIQATDLGLVGYAIFHSENLRDSLHRFARYIHILSEALQFSFVESADKVVLTWRAHPALASLGHPVETGASLIIALGREISGVNLHPQLVELPGPRPDDVMAYRAVCACPVNFDRPAATVTYSKKQLDLPTRAPDATLVGYLDELAAITLHPLEDRDQSLAEAVRNTLWSMLPGGRPDLWRTAEDLGISVRTLQRRLGEEGTSFSKVLDDLRRDVSDELLADRKLAIADVAFMLGYSEPSAFQRAYRRWRGVSPRRGVA